MFTAIMYLMYIYCIVCLCYDIITQAHLLETGKSDTVTITVKNKIFTLHKNKQSWATAKNICYTSGGHLAKYSSLESSDTKSIHFSSLLELGKAEVAWIGALVKKVNISSDVFLKSNLKDKMQSDTSLWCGSVSFKHESNENSILEKKSKYHQVITKQKCSDSFHFICKLEENKFNPRLQNNGKTTSGRTKRINPEFCPRSVKTNYYVAPNSEKNSTGSCYEFHKPTNWYKAWWTCKNKNGTLFNEINIGNLNMQQRKAVKAMLKHLTWNIVKSDRDYLWVQRSNHFWTWESDGSLISFDDKMGNQLLGQGHCGTLRHRGYFLSDWINSNCSDHHLFICEKDISNDKNHRRKDKVKEYDCFRTIKIFPSIQKFSDILIVGPYLLVGILISLFIMAFPLICMKCKICHLEKKLRKCTAPTENNLYSMSMSGINGRPRSPVMDMHANPEYACPGDWLPIYIPPPPKEKPPPIPCSCERCERRFNKPFIHNIPRIEIDNQAEDQKPPNKYKSILSKLRRTPKKKDFELMYTTATRRNAISSSYY